MLYREAFRQASLLTPYEDCDKYPCKCTYCLSYELQPLHVDDKNGVHFLICEKCGRIYTRPTWYMTPEQHTIRILTEKIAHLEAKLAALEKQPQPRYQKATQREESSTITLPNLLTV